MIHQMCAWCGYGSVCAKQCDGESIWKEVEAAEREKDEKKGRPHAFANWHSQTEKLVKDKNKHLVEHLSFLDHLIKFVSFKHLRKTSL